ncbi:RNA repair transcriptional activator RtcR family protein [Endozoicomonas lisbonensis]|uniref:Sigma54-dependent transcription regulator n=1 Tax=Endozoicomonas lisbonensis TaxID=3120522 RepID=A0ABV2SL66_9GAMM
MISILGTTKDVKGGKKATRWTHWRPTVSVVMHEAFPVDRMELIYHPQHLAKALIVAEYIRIASPDTEVALIEAVWENPWDFAEIYHWFYEFARHYPVNTDEESYYLNITTGTHVSQICMFLMSEAHLLPAQILQVSPVTQSGDKAKGSLHSIDLDLARYESWQSATLKNPVLVRIF